MAQRGLSLGIDARTLGATGIGRYVTELVSHMAPEHPETKFHLFMRSDSVDLFERQMTELGKGGNVTSYSTKATYYSLHEQLRYGRQLDDFHFDAVHFPNFNAPRYISTPYVATVHDLILLRFPGRSQWPGKRYLYKLVLNRTIRQAQKIITGSDWARRDVMAYAEDIGVANAADKVVSIPLGLGDSFWQPMTDKAVKDELSKLSIDKPYFLTVGAQYRHKNIHRAVAAFNDLMKYPDMRDYRLVISGRRTLPAPHLDEALRQYPLAAERVIFTDQVSELTLRALYRGATALFFASEMEGFGLPILEAQASETPVITSCVTAMPETAGGAALLVKPTDVSAIARAFRRVAQGKIDASLIKNGLENARKFTWKTTAKQTYEIYQQATSRR